MKKSVKQCLISDFGQILSAAGNEVATEISMIQALLRQWRRLVSVRYFGSFQHLLIVALRTTIVKSIMIDQVKHISTS